MPSQHFEEDPEMVAKIIESKQQGPLVIEPIQHAVAACEVCEREGVVRPADLHATVEWRDQPVRIALCFDCSKVAGPGGGSDAS